MNVRVRIEDGSYIHVSIEKRYIIDHFNMYVDFIRLIQKTSDERFLKIPKGHGQKSDKINAFDCDLDTSFTYLII